MSALLLLLLLPTLARCAPNCFVNHKSQMTECYEVVLKPNQPLTIDQYTDTLKIFPPVKELPAGSFTKLPRLKALIVNYTMMTEIQEDTFKGLAGLVVLDLFWNQISHIPPYTFHHCSNLVHLNLGGNDLENLERPVFRPLTSLQELILSANMLSSVPDFESLSRLTYLDLSKNRIKGIGRQDFRGLYNLQRLTLRNNRISFIEEKAFGFLGNLVFLNLEVNDLVAIDVQDLTAGLGSLRQVRIGINKFSCRDLRRIVGELTAKNITMPEGLAEPDIISYHGWFCYPPEVIDVNTGMIVDI